MYDVTSTGSGTYLCPVFLLVDLPRVRGSTSCSIDWQAMDCWATYLLVPHHFVSACLAHRTGKLGIVFLGIALAEFIGDFISCIALFELISNANQFERFPTGLAIGYGLTSIGFVWMLAMCCKGTGGPQKGFRSPTAGF